MHEIRATIPPEGVPEAVRLAHAVGITRVTVADVFVHGPDEDRRLVSVDTSTPKARAFVDAFLGSATLSQTNYTLTSREVRFIVADESLAGLTLPMREPVHGRNPGSLANGPRNRQLYRPRHSRGDPAGERDY